MRALVTGGAGFIGSNLVRKLVAEDADVIVLDNFDTGHKVNLKDFTNIKLIESDVRNRENVEGAARGVDVIFHLAASVGNKRSIDDPLHDAEVNVIGTLNVLEAARKNKVKKVVYSSSAGTFGELKTLPIKEDHPAEPDSPYGASKLCAEKDCLVYSKLYDIDSVCLRYFNVYGPGQRFDAYGNVIPIFVFKLLGGESIKIFGDGKQTRDFINVRDVVEANFKAATTHGARGAFNIGSGTSISINDLVAEIGKAMGQKPKFVYAPKRPGDVLDSLACIDAAKEAFGFSPSVDMPEGLAEYVAWARTATAES